jgi:putative spermidine/putrescine transport system ATP-binding protein
MQSRHSIGSALELRNVGKSYGTTTAVHDVSLGIAPGEFVSFLGPSGSGKTTTLMLIAGFLFPDRGQVLLDGADITSSPPHKRNFGMVYQNYALFPHMTVARNVAFPLEMRGVPRPEIRRRVVEALELVQLADKADRMPRQLSGGQQQRVALARALVFAPPILLMDEPLGALDKKLRIDMQNEIKSIQRRLSITTIYVTHDQDEALSMSDRVAVMRAGRIEQIAAPTELYDRPATRFVAEFIGAANLLPVTVIGSAESLTVRTGTGLTFDAPAADHPSGEPLTAVVRPERILIAPAADGTGHAGVVEESAFGGGLWRYQLRLQTGDRLFVTESNLGRPPFKVGDAVRAAWWARDVTIIAATSE